MVGRLLGHIAERAETGTDIAEDEKGCLAATKAFGNVRTVGLLADGMQLQVSQEPFHLGMGRRRNLFLEPFGTAGNLHTDTGSV